MAAHPNSLSQVDVFSFQRSKQLQDYCGDAYFYIESEHHFFCILVDGLGSGIEAYRSAQAIINAIDTEEDQNLLMLTEKANQAVNHLRGAAVAMISANLETHQISYCGIGNIRFYMIGETGKLTFPLATAGYLSGRQHRYKLKTLTFKAGSKFLMHSDGFELPYVKKYLESPQNIAQIGHQMAGLVKDVPNDDVTFLLGQFP